MTAARRTSILLTSTCYIGSKMAPVLWPGGPWFDRTCSKILPWVEIGRRDCHWKPPKLKGAKCQNKLGKKKGKKIKVKKKEKKRIFGGKKLREVVLIESALVDKNCWQKMGWETFFFFSSSFSKWWKLERGGGGGEERREGLARF